jgi:glutamyl-tRNA reductase
MISVISLNFLRTDLSIRSYFQFTENEINHIYKVLKADEQLNGLLILDTCNRTEIYIDHDSGFNISKLLGDLQQLKETSIPSELFIVIRNTELAVKYIVEVAIGLHSMVIGDNQILNQFKKAFKISQQNHFISGNIERIFQAVFRSHKRIANETGYHKGSRSVSHLAVNEIKRRFRDKATPVLVIGAGEIAADLLKYLSAQSFTNVTIANRTMLKAQLISRLYNYTVARYDLSTSLLNEFEVIISCAAKENVLSSTMLKRVDHKLLVDLTTFRSIQDIPESTNQLVTLDDFANLREIASKEQLTAIEKVNQIIAEEINTFFVWMNRRTQLLEQITL